jgi:hypothetical protein
LRNRQRRFRTTYDLLFRQSPAASKARPQANPCPSKALRTCHAGFITLQRRRGDGGDSRFALRHIE